MWLIFDLLVDYVFLLECHPNHLIVSYFNKNKMKYDTFLEISYFILVLLN